MIGGPACAKPVVELDQSTASGRDNQLAASNKRREYADHEIQIHNYGDSA